jgi:hypothetical protein
MTVPAPHSEAAVMPLPDHVMVLLDDETYRDVTACDFLSARFARVQPKAADSSLAGQYSTLGLAGTSTLLELFCGAVPGPRRYTGGLVFSFERPGAVPDARRTLRDAAGIEAHYQLVERADPGSRERRPWYHLLAPDLGADTTLLVMLNQVTPEYYAGLGATAGPDGELLRHEYLSAVLRGAPDGERMLGDLVGVTVRLRPAHAQRLLAALVALGYRSQAGALYGPSFRVTLDPDVSAPEGVTGLLMALGNPPAEREELRFGKGSRLVLDPGGTATWTFVPVE